MVCKLLKLHSNYNINNLICVKYYETNRAIRKILFATLLFIMSISVGTIGYMLIEGYSLVDAAYMAVITFSTVGFNEVNPLSQTGRIFTAIFITQNLVIFE